MSFELFIIFVKDGDYASCERTVVEDILMRDAIDPVFPIENIHYSDGHAMDIIGLANASESIDSFSISRFFGETILARLLEISAKANAVIGWPGENPHLAVASHSTIAHMPAALVKEPEAVVAVGSVAELMEVMELIWINAALFEAKTPGSTP